MQAEKVDLVIVGGGLVGASLAIALEPLALNIVLLEANEINSKKKIKEDTRSIALSDSSRRILTALDCWPLLEAHTTPIKNIHISELGKFGHTFLDAHDQNLDTFGFVTGAETLTQTIQRKLLTLKHTRVFAGAKVETVDWEETETTVTAIDNKGTVKFKAKLLVAADGVNSSLRELAQIKTRKQDYRHAAIACSITTQKFHQYTAYEKFTKLGAIAFLPREESVGCVVTVEKNSTAELLALSDEDFLQRVQQQFGFYLGKLLSVGKKVSYPLAMVHAEQQVKNRFVLLGNAAHTMHPIAAQGFNLGLRDVACLATFIAEMEEQLQDFGDGTLLKAYENARIKEQNSMIRFTDNLVRAFDLDFFPCNQLRSKSLAVLDFLPFLKKKIARFGMGHFNQLPYLALGVPLKKPTNKNCEEVQHD